MDTSPVGTPQLALHPFRALRLAETLVGAPFANRVFARPYRSVPGRLRDWRRKRHLRVDSEPGIYLHEYTSAGMSVRGIVANLELAHTAGLVFPHEDVNPAQVVQLTHRMREMNLNPAPILLVHRGGPGLRSEVDRVAARTPHLSYTDRAEQLHRIWRITDPAEQQSLAEAASTGPLVIADGHHRFAAAQVLRAEEPETGWERTLVMLVDQDDTPLQLGAVHRSITGLTLATVESAAQRRGDEFVRHESRAAALADLEDALVLHDGQRWATLRPAQASPLLVCTLHTELLEAWGVTPRALDHHHTAASALDAAGRGLAVLLPAPTFDEVVRAAAEGVLLPQKATSFQPKPHLGAIMRDLRDG